MPSYTQYMRQMAVMDADDDIESWITVRGNHIPIKKGQSKEDAVKSFIEKKGGKEKGGDYEAQGRETAKREASHEFKKRSGVGLKFTELGKGDHGQTIGQLRESGKDVGKLDKAMQYVHYGFKEEKGNKMSPQQLLDFLEKRVKESDKDKNFGDRWAKSRFPEAIKLVKEYINGTEKKESDSRLVNAVATALGTSVEEAESEIEGAAQYIHDLIKAKDLRNGDVEETLRGLGVEPDYADEFMQWATYPRRKKK